MSRSFVILPGEAAAQLIVGVEPYEPRTKTFVHVNNRLEGNALESSAAVVARAIELLTPNLPA